MVRIKETWLKGVFRMLTRVNVSIVSLPVECSAEIFQKQVFF
ncbi:MAG: hypothetical protein LZF60_340076 [Nitrospira sp.]|nr:MAG: hypothetical protein LZF60_340076 [Nitrospira sp.]